jgi:hypothetical protein
MRIPQNTHHGTARSRIRNILTAGIPGSFILNQLQVYYVTNFIIIFVKKWHRSGRIGHSKEPTCPLCEVCSPETTHYPVAFNAEIKPVRATLPDGSFYWGVCFLNRAFR